MSQNTEQAAAPGGGDAHAATAIEDPIEFLKAEHARQRDICDELERLIEPMQAAAVQPKAETLLAFLTHELALHIADEEKDLFPLLAARCLPEDNLKGLLKQLQREHEMDEDLVDFLRDDLAVLARGHRLANPTRLLINLREFVVTQRRHLGWEDETVLPLAERRLTPADRAAMAGRMAARRRGA